MPKMTKGQKDFMAIRDILLELKCKIKKTRKGKQWKQEMENISLIWRQNILVIGRKRLNYPSLRGVTH